MEKYDKGVLINFSITNLLDSCTFQFSNKNLSVKNKNYIKEILFDKTTTLYGFDEPFISIVKEQLQVRGKQDYYVIDKKLNIKLDLRDTLMKYIPSAYKEVVDNSGNHMTFNWHRDFYDDTLKIKVFYEYDKTGNHTKEWETLYIIK